MKAMQELNLYAKTGDSSTVTVKEQLSAMRDYNNAIMEMFSV